MTTVKKNITNNNIKLPTISISKNVVSNCPSSVRVEVKSSNNDNNTVVVCSLHGPYNLSSEYRGNKGRIRCNVSLAPFASSKCFNVKKEGDLSNDDNNDIEFTYVDGFNSKNIKGIDIVTAASSYYKNLIGGGGSSYNSNSNLYIKEIEMVLEGICEQVVLLDKFPQLFYEVSAVILVSGTNYTDSSINNNNIKINNDLPALTTALCALFVIADIEIIDLFTAANCVLFPLVYCKNTDKNINQDNKGYSIVCNPSSFIDFNSCCIDKDDKAGIDNIFKNNINAVADCCVVATTGGGNIFICNNNNIINFDVDDNNGDKIKKNDSFNIKIPSIGSRILHTSYNSYSSNFLSSYSASIITEMVQSCVDYCRSQGIVIASQLY